MPTLVACMWQPVEAIQLGRVPTRFGPATRLRRPESQWNQGALAAWQVEMCPRTANSGLTMACPQALAAWMAQAVLALTRDEAPSRQLQVPGHPVPLRPVGAGVRVHHEHVPHDRDLRR